MSSLEMNNNFEPDGNIISQSDSNSSLISMFTIDSRSNSCDFDNDRNAISKSYDNLKSLITNPEDKIIPLVKSCGSLLSTSSLDSCSKSCDSLKELGKEYIEEDTRPTLKENNSIFNRRRRPRDARENLAKSPQVKDVLKYLNNISISQNFDVDFNSDKK